jgi:hypothetical protein
LVSNGRRVLPSDFGGEQATGTSRTGKSPSAYDTHLGAMTCAYPIRRRSPMTRFATDATAVDIRARSLTTDGRVFAVVSRFDRFTADSASGSL